MLGWDNVGIFLEFKEYKRAEKKAVAQRKTYESKDETTTMWFSM